MVLVYPKKSFTSTAKSKFIDFRREILLIHKIKSKSDMLKLCTINKTFSTISSLTPPQKLFLLQGYGFLRQHRIIIVVRLRSQIFRQIVQKRRRRADARQGVFVRYDGKYASKRAAKALAGNCAVLP